MSPGDSAREWTRRRVLACGIGGFIGAAFAGIELVEHGVLPGRQTLDELDGACSASSPALTFATAGPSSSGRFFSAARNRMVGYTIAYPPEHGPGSALPPRSHCTASAATTQADSETA